MIGHLLRKYSQLRVNSRIVQIVIGPNTKRLQVGPNLTRLVHFIEGYLGQIRLFWKLRKKSKHQAGNLIL